MNLRRILIGGSLFLLLVAIPLTVYVAQQQQQTQSQAQKSTNLCFVETPATPSTATLNCGPATIAKKAGDTFSLDIIMDPGTNQVSTVRLNLVYDATKLSTTSAGILPAPNVVTPLTETTYGTGTATARYGIIINASEVDPTKVLSQKTKIATITFKVNDSVTPGTTSITFGQTLVLSSNPADGQDEDVLSSATPLSVSLSAGTGGVTPTSTITANTAPSCTALNVDRTTSGSAPFSITFTVNGRDTDGTITKVTFDYGDGPVEDVLATGGIGTNTVSAQRAHTYNNAGTYAAKTTLTDDRNAISSASATCAQTITVTPSIGGATATPSATTPKSVIATSTPIPSPTIDPGPEDALLGIGALGIVIAIIGGILSFAF